MLKPFKIILAASILITAGTAQAQTGCESIGQGLTTQQTTDLCRIVRLKSPLTMQDFSPQKLKAAGIELTKYENKFLAREVGEFSSASPYSVSEMISTERSCHHALILLGELHLKNEKAWRAGRDVVRSFQFRGYEDANASALSKGLASDPKIQRKLKTWIKLYKILVTKHVIHGSTIEDELLGGLTISDHNIVNYKTDVKVFGSHGQFSGSFGLLGQFLASDGLGRTLFLNSMNRCWDPTAPVPVEVQGDLKDPEKFLRSFNTLLAGDPSIKLNFDMESGFQLPPNDSCKSSDSDCDKILLDARNKVMARNLERIVRLLPCKAPFIFVVGKNHIPGLIAILKASHRFQIPKTMGIGIGE